MRSNLQGTKNKTMLFAKLEGDVYRFKILDTKPFVENAYNRLNAPATTDGKILSPVLL